MIHCHPITRGSRALGKVQRVPATLLLALLLAPAAQAERISHSAAMAADGSVELSNYAGSVEVRAWSRAEVELTGSIDDDVKEVVFQPDKRNVRIRVVVDERRHSHDADADLLLRIPADASLKVSTVSADIDVEGVLGRQRLRSVSGDIDTEVAAADLEVENISGEVRVRGSNQTTRLNVSVVSGDVELTDVSGEVEIRAVSGDVEIEAGSLRRALLNNTSGDMRVSGRTGPNARIEMKAVSGDVILALCGPREGEFDLESFSGDIIDLVGDHEVQRDRYGPGSELRFREGGSGTRVEIDTMSGNIELDDC